VFKEVDYVILYVSDLKRSIQFYCDKWNIPLKLRAQNYAEFRTRGTRLALFDAKEVPGLLGVKGRKKKYTFEVAFKVTDCDRTFAALKAASVKPIVPPTDRAWGQRTAYFEDPDGHLLEIAQDLKQAK